MYAGLTLSLTVHVALLGWALVNFQATPAYKIPEPEPVEVALISEDDLVRLTKGDRDSKNLKTQASEQTDDAPVEKEAKKARVKTVQPPPSAEPPPQEPDTLAEKLASLEPPKPAGPTLEELAAKAASEAAAEKLKAEKVAEELALKKAADEEQKKQAEAEKKRKAAEAEKKRKADEAKRKKAEAEKQRKKKQAEKRREERKRKLAEKRRREREAEKKKFDPGRLAALLNKIPDSKAPIAGSTDPNTDRNLPRGAQAGAPEGTDTRLTASQASLLGAMMKREVSRCWNINSGLEGIDRIVIDIDVRLRPDGRIDGQPKVVNRGRGALFQDAANNAMRALVQCEPYSLPKDLYKGGWDHMVVTFDPQKMF